MTLAQITIDIPHGGEARVPSDLANHPWLSELITSFMDTTPIIGILVILMFLDVVTGYFAAGISGEIDSTISYKGAMKKAQMLLAVAAGTVFERIQPGVPWGKIIASLAAVGEMWSILENMAKSGVPMPQGLKDMLIRLKQHKETAPLVNVVVHETDKEAISKAVTELKASDRDTVHDVCDRVGGKIQQLQADVKEASQSLRDSGILKHDEIVKPQRKDVHVQPPNPPRDK